MKHTLSGETKGPTVTLPGGRFQPSKTTTAEVPPDPLSKDGGDSMKATSVPESRRAEPTPTPETSANKKYRGPEGRIELFLDTQR